MRVNMIQWSTGLLGKDRDVLAGRYYDALWKKRRGVGYWRPRDFWEVPLWAAHLAGQVMQNDVGLGHEVRFCVAHSVEEAEGMVPFDPDTITCLSVLDCNRHLVEELVQRRPLQSFVVGGYADMATLSTYPNVTVCDTMADFTVGVLGLKYWPGAYDYGLWQGLKTMPRLRMSTGCLHQCSFCTVPHGKVTVVTAADVVKQVLSFRYLKFRLVYLDDKTWGQARNYTLLAMLAEEIHRWNPEFLGFVVQTTADTANRLPADVWKEQHIAFVEIGVESYNDHILKVHHKPAREKSINEAMEKIEQSIGNHRIIPNILVGLPEETKATYGNTLMWLDDHAEWFSHLNVYNLALYEGSEIAGRLCAKDKADRNENVTAKSWQRSHAHAAFSDQMYARGLEMLDYRVTARQILESFQ